MNEKAKMEEMVNSIININGLLYILASKGIVTPQELIDAKKIALNDLKKEYPQLFKNNETASI